MLPIAGGCSFPHSAPLPRPCAMPPRPGSPSSDALSIRVARSLYRSLETTLTKQFAQRYDAGILLRCPSLRRVAESPNDASLVDIRVGCRGLTTMQAQLLVTCMDGGGYDVLCTVEEGKTHRFSYHFPDSSPPSRNQLVPLAKDLGTFLRRELENQIGRLLLHSPARPPRTDSGTLL